MSGAAVRRCLPGERSLNPKVGLVIAWTRYEPGIRLGDVVVSTTQDPSRARFVKMRMSKRYRKESTSEEWRLRALRSVVALFAALVVSLTLTAAASANVSFTKAYGWGVVDGLSQFETCTSTCEDGIYGGGAGQFEEPGGIATDSSGDVYVADTGNNRIDEFSAAGAFIKAYGWGVSDGASQFETCTSTCQIGAEATGAGAAQQPRRHRHRSLGRRLRRRPLTTRGSTSSLPPARSSRPTAGA